MARVLPLVWLGGSAVFLIVILAGGVAPGTVPENLVIDALGWAMALTLLFGGDRLPEWFEEASQYYGFAIISAIVAISGDPATPFALFYLWLAVQATYFVPWRRALPQLGAIAVGYGVALAIASDAGFPLTRWAMMVATVFVVAALVAYMRDRLNTLVGVLNEAADTDELTGLGNRRLLLAELDDVLEHADERPSTVAIFDLDGFKAYNDIYGHPAGDLLLRRLGLNLAAAVKPLGRAFRLGGDEFCVLIAAEGPEARAVVGAAASALSEEGEGFDVGASSGSVALPQEARDASEALRIADRRMYFEKGQRSGAAEQQTRDVLLRILHEREPELREHLQGVARRVNDLAQALNLDAEELDVLVRAAELHDVGKIGIPDDVLHKRGDLDEIEWGMIRTHTLIGERILGGAPAMSPVAGLVRASHERWDGGGYPDGLAGEDIPLGSRAIFVCDAYEAMTTDRPYRPALTPEAAVDELRANSGTQFDPALVDLFLERLPAHAERP